MLNLWGNGGGWSGEMAVGGDGADGCRVGADGVQYEWLGGSEG